LNKGCLKKLLLSSKEKIFVRQNEFLEEP